MTSLEDKVVVITGASSGIGRAVAREFIRRGTRLVLAARSLDKLQALCGELNPSGDRCLAVRTDVTREADVEQLFLETEKRFGRVDILVNNAGRGLKSRLIDTDMDEWLSVIHTNLTSVYLCTRMAAISMVHGSVRGHIITVASIAGLFSAPGYAAYCASKRGVTGLLQAAKWELRKLGIKTSTIFPFRVDTEFFDIYPGRPSRRQMLSARDIARYITAIASRSWLLRSYIRLVLVLKRIYNLIRPSFSRGPS
ncbi:MAG: SDR family oxidoreductase [Fidelibacterota bacterium]|nr:MAG: SDR family oxidoreductase [Candidatus Neomarinimicrobiota bacterium]